ncbi:cell death activator CIDE-3-like isoform X1 [Gouania willdenowi]|uniref:cell death activator CIDE-3-like isoform X1 n=2 Tax=Gouania willdenowi TaxID=441366 RepID=UPI0010553530|nr:cell death activator CIDE-3 isoform X1 [Gouania willdenowi]
MLKYSLMDYAMKSLSLLSLASLSKCVTARASMTQQLMSSRAPPRSKPFRITNAARSVKKGIMADTVDDLMNKVGLSLGFLSISAVVLDEDGTCVDTEDFFQTLPENTCLMVLEKAQRWTLHSDAQHKQLQERTDVARLTLDFYKNDPDDLIGCLNVKATLYGAYSVSYDLRCHAAKRILKEALRWTVFSMQATGHILLGSSCYMEQLLNDERRAVTSLALPVESSRISQLQSMVQLFLPRVRL